jgi:RNA polymerase sigma-B factor
MVRQRRHTSPPKDENVAPVTTEPTPRERTTRLLDDHLDPDVEQLVAELAATDDERSRAELREQVVVRALPLADAIALRYRGRGIETDDLLQVARTALVKAVSRYRPGAGHGFAAFASPTISGELKRWFRDQGWAVRPPRRLQELRASLVVEEERMRHVLGRDPHDAELAEVLGTTVAEIEQARSCSAGYHAVSLDTPTASGANLSELLLVSAAPSGAVDTRDALHRSLATLTDRQRRVLRLRYVDELTQAEIGELIGVSQMQVSRIIRDTVAHLRADILVDDRVHETTAA